MADHRVSDLAYGQFGQAIYEPESKKWYFSRNIGQNSVLQLQGRPEVLLHASTTFAQPCQKPEQGIPSLARRYQEIAPGLSLLPAHAQVSEAVTSVTRVHDSIISTRLAFGEAWNPDHKLSGKRIVTIVAIVSGAVGETVRLARAPGRHLGWDKKSKLLLRGPDVINGEHCRWTGSFAPVRQVCFAQSKGRPGSWFAVRQANATTIFRPQFHRKAVVPLWAEPEYGFMPSRMDANPIVSIPIGRTGTSAHADVTFNPWYHPQVAILDESGRWSIWNIEGTRNKRNTYKAILEKNGSIQQSETEDSEEVKASDGWARLSWVTDVHTLVICDRRTLQIINLKPDLAVTLPAPDLALTRTSGWVLDLKRSPVDDSHIFVLTSFQIFWIEVVSVAAADQGNTKLPGGRILLSWRHFRHGEDISLQLNVVNEVDETLLLLYSKYTSLVTVFQCSRTSTHALPFSVSNPFILDIPRDVWAVGAGKENDWHRPKERDLSDLLLVPIKHFKRYADEQEDSHDAHEDDNVHFYRLFILANDLSLHACLYNNGVSPTRLEDKTLQCSELAGYLGEPSDPPKPKKKVFKSARIVEDDESADDQAHDNPWTLDYEFVYDFMFKQARLTSARPEEWLNSTEKSQIDILVSNVRNKLSSKINAGPIPLQTLLELFSPPSGFSDTCEASSPLCTLLQPPEQQTADPLDKNDLSSALSLRKVAPWSFSAFSAEAGSSSTPASHNQPLSLSSIYDEICRQWLAPVKRKLSQTAYEAHERDAKQTALVLWHASIAVEHQPSRDAGAEQQQQGDGQLEPGGENQLSLPLRGRDLGSLGIGSSQLTTSNTESIATLDLSQPSSSSPLNTSNRSRPTFPLTPTPTPSIHTEPTSSTAPPSEEDPASARLRAYTSLKPQAPPPSSVSRILSHWTLGADPNQYSYQATQQALQGPEDDGAGGTRDGSDDRSSRDKRKQRPRHAHHRPPEQGTTGGFGERHLPKPFLSSQPGPPGEWDGSQRSAKKGAAGAFLSQETDLPDEIPMSQVERGVFGGRQATHHESAGRKKRRRVAGF